MAKSGNLPTYPSPKPTINTYFSLRANCWVRGGIGGQFVISSLTLNSIAHEESTIGNIKKNERDGRGTAAPSVLVGMSGKSPPPPPQVTSLSKFSTFFCEMVSTRMYVRICFWPTVLKSIFSFKIAGQNCVCNCVLILWIFSVVCTCSVQEVKK